MRDKTLGHNSEMEKLDDLMRKDGAQKRLYREISLGFAKDREIQTGLKIGPKLDVNTIFSHSPH